MFARTTHQPKNPFLITAALLNFAAALLHIAVILGGPDWYRFFGAGEEMAYMAERGEIYPALITLGIAAVLAIWGLYALAGAGYRLRLPLMIPALYAIAAIYSLRAALSPLLSHFFWPQHFDAFMLWSSAICGIYALAHVLGLITLRRRAYAT